MSRRTIALVVGAFVAGGAIVWAGIAIFGGRGANKVAGPAETTTTTLPLSDTARELLDRLKKGNGLELHATYSSTDASGSTLTVDIWRKGGRVRQDIVLEGSGVKNQIEAFQLPEGNVACQTTTGAEWMCQKVASLATQSGASAGLFDAAAANLNGKEVTATDEKVGDDDARCYAIADVAAPGSTSTSTSASEMCITSAGLPVRLSSQGSNLTLSSVERSVADAVFVPPAPITELTPPTSTVN